MENKDYKISILKQRKEAAEAKIMIASVVKDTLEQWGDKAITKRLANAIQESLDEVFGTEPLTEEQKNSWVADNRKHWSNVNVSYSTESNWSDEKRYRLEVYSRKMVKPLPDLNKQYMDGKKYTTPDPNDDHDIRIGTTFAEGMDELIKAFDYSQSDAPQKYQQAIDRIEEVDEQYWKTRAAISDWFKLTDGLGTAGYAVRDLYKEIKRIY